MFSSISQPIPIVVNTVLDAGYSEALPSSLMGALSDSQTAGRKRDASGNVVEKIVERRQKRMIKNRESAARSRARKQVIFGFLHGVVALKSYLSFLLLF